MGLFSFEWQQDKKKEEVKDIFFMAKAAFVGGENSLERCIHNL